MKYIQQLSRQLALDYCCTPADILDQGNHFTEYRSLEGRRRFEDQDNCALKITAVNRKLIFTGKKEIIELCREKYETCPGAWFMDVANFRELDHILKPYGCQLKSPDMLGVAAISDGKIIGMAGASADSPLFWQIGINVEKEAECRHIASTLVTILKEEIEKLGKVPYYGTSMSNLASQRAAVNAGFRVAWVELLAEAKI